MLNILLLLSLVLPLALAIPILIMPITSSNQICAIHFAITIFAHHNCYVPPGQCTENETVPSVRGAHDIIGLPALGDQCFPASSGASGSSFTVGFIGENCQRATGAAATGTKMRWWSGDNCDGEVLGETPDLGTVPLLPCFGVDEEEGFGSLELIGYLG